MALPLGPINSESSRALIDLRTEEYPGIDCECRGISPHLCFINDSNRQG